VQAGQGKGKVGCGLGQDNRRSHPFRYSPNGGDLQLRLGDGHQRHAGFRDSRFLEGDARHRLLRGAFLWREQEAFVVDAQSGDPASGKHVCLQNICRIEAATHAYLDHAGIGRRTAEGQKCCGDGYFEEAGTKVLASVENFLEDSCQHLIRNQLASDADTLVVTHQVRAGGGVNLVSLCFQHGAQEGADRSLAIGPRDMEHRRQAFVRIA